MYDVAVVGSGAAAMVAALAAARHGLRVVMLERTATVGGTSAMSGGLIYAPGSKLAVAQGHAADTEEVMLYLRAVARRPLDEHAIRAYLNAAPAVADFLVDEGVAMRLASIPDYYADRPGAGTGRVLATEPFDPAALGTLAGLVRCSPYRELPEHEPWTNGMSLIGHLLTACLRRGVTVRTGWRASSLIRRGAAVVGVRGERSGTPADVSARFGVVLATGGIEFNAGLRERHVEGVVESAWSCPGNEGDGLLMAVEAGAALTPVDVQWYPLLRLGDEQLEGAPLMADASPARNLPGSIIVDRGGRRFANEGQMFQDLGRTLGDPKRGLTATWLIVDQAYLDRYRRTAFGVVHLSAPHWTTAESVADLARRVEVEPATLTATVDRFNRQAAAGVDDDYGRGASRFDQAWGDSSREGSAACLAPLRQPPFHATRVYAGCSGTTGGPVVDTSSRVLDEAGSVIPGLFAAGNVTASLFGGAAPGSGSTLGPGMVAAWLAAMSMVRTPYDTGVATATGGPATPPSGIRRAR
jgi:3-oxosteroid 1-dehydrogenase